MNKMTIVLGQSSCGKTETLIKLLVDNYQNNKRSVWYEFEDDINFLGQRIVNEIKKRGIEYDADRINDLVHVYSIPSGTVSFQNLLNNKGKIFTSCEKIGKIDTFFVDSISGFTRNDYRPYSEILNNGYTNLRKISDEYDVEFVFVVNEQLVGTVLKNLGNFLKNDEKIIELPRKLNYV